MEISAKCSAETRIFMEYTWNEEEQKAISDIYRRLRAKLAAERDNMGERIPYMAVDGIYADMGKDSINWWTNGFWPGIMWQMYHADGEERFRQEAFRVEERLEEAFANYGKLDHDVGFLWLHTSVARFRLTGEADARTRGLRAADVLLSRFCSKGQYIRAWNPPQKSGMIIDCLMNLPLLYWAEKETGQEKYGSAARAHLETAMKYLLRQDGSSNHIAEFSEETGEVTALPGGQGYKEGSSWSRGQAWAVYGLALSYGYTGKEEVLSRAKAAAHYFIANVAQTGYVSVIDFRAPLHPLFYDASAAACAACGLLELARHVGEHEKPLYRKAAYCIFQALTKDFCDFSLETEGILQKSSAKYHRESDREKSIIYGDYFLVELVLRLCEKGFMIW